MNPNQEPTIITDFENAPWYQSTQGPKISTTVKAVAGLIIPELIQLGVIKTGLPWLDSVIDIASIAFFGAYILYGHIRAKKTLAGTITYWKNIATQPPKSAQTSND